MMGRHVDGGQSGGSVKTQVVTEECLSNSFTSQTFLWSVLVESVLQARRVHSETIFEAAAVFLFCLLDLIGVCLSALLFYLHYL